MAHIDTLTPGELAELLSLLGREVSAEDARRLISSPGVIETMAATMRDAPEFLVNGLFTPLARKIEMVKSWPGIDPTDVDAAVQKAYDNGTIAGYEVEVKSNHLLDLVFVTYRGSVPDTLSYLLSRARDVWGYCHGRSDGYYSDVNDEYIKLADGVRAFTPNSVVLVAIDFGANHNPTKGVTVEEVRAAQAPIVEDFGVIANAIQSPGWIRGGVSYAVAAGLLINLPGSVEWCLSPDVSRDDDGRLYLGESADSDLLYEASVPVRRNYQC